MLFAHFERKLDRHSIWTQSGSDMVRWFDAAFDGTGRTAEQASRVEWLCLNNASVTVADGDRGQMLRAFIYKPPSPPGSNKKSLFCRLFDIISKGQSVLLCRQHCRLSICGHFGWVWQILSEANPNTNWWWDEQACLLLCWFSVRLMLKSLFSFLKWVTSLLECINYFELVSFRFYLFRGPANRHMGWVHPSLGQQRFGHGKKGEARIRGGGKKFANEGGKRLKAQLCILSQCQNKVQVELFSLTSSGVHQTRIIITWSD